MKNTGNLFGTKKSMGFINTKFEVLSSETMLIGIVKLSFFMLSYVLQFCRLTFYLSFFAQAVVLPEAQFQKKLT